MTTKIEHPANKEAMFNVASQHHHQDWLHSSSSGEVEIMPLIWILSYLRQREYEPSWTSTCLHFFLHLQTSVFIKEIEAYSCYQACQALKKYLKNLPNTFTTGNVFIIFSPTHFNCIDTLKIHFLISRISSCDIRRFSFLHTVFGLDFQSFKRFHTAFTHCTHRTVWN